MATDLPRSVRVPLKMLVRWLGRRRSREVAASDNPGGVAQQAAADATEFERQLQFMNPETVKATAELAAKEYADENDRLKSLDGKAGVLAGAAGGAAFYVASSVLQLFNASRVQVGLLVLALIVLALLSFLLADVWFLRALAIRDFRRIKLPEWATYDSLDDEPVRLYARLVTTYRKLVVENSAQNNDKATNIEWGTWTLFAGLVMLGLVMVLRAVLGNPGL